MLFLLLKDLNIFIRIIRYYNLKPLEDQICSSRSTHVHHLYNRVTDAPCQVSRFLKTGKKIFYVLIIYGGDHLDHMTWTICINFLSPFPGMIHMQFGFDWPSVLEKIFEKCGRMDERMDGRRTDARGLVCYSSVSRPKGSGELKMPFQC